MRFWVDAFVLGVFSSGLGVVMDAIRFGRILGLLKFLGLSRLRAINKENRLGAPNPKSWQHIIEVVQG